jgi:membrane-associated phospholipid phosphatase
MSQTRPIIPVERSASADHVAAGPRRNGNGMLLSFPVLDEQPGWLGRRLATLPRKGHPVWTYVCGILIAFALIASISIVLGLIVTRALLHVHGVAGDDERFVGFLARHRSTGLTDASLVGSIIAGGVVLPIIAGIAALAACIAKHWRLAGFLLFALAVESGSYRATTLVVHRHRPEVHRLENLAINASYPSGHTAASIAIYGGIALLLTSRIKNRGAQVAIWVVAALIPVFVALSRMYRGMHHPLDVMGGVVIGIAALSALVLVTRAAGHAAE